MYSGREQNYYDNELFHYTPIYDLADIICKGSDEEETPEQTRQKRFRYEINAERCAQGKLPVLQSTVLKGPFSSNWINPWRYKSTKPLGHNWRVPCSENILLSRADAWKESSRCGLSYMGPIGTLPRCKESTEEEAIQAGTLSLDTKASGRNTDKTDKDLTSEEDISKNLLINRYDQSYKLILKHNRPSVVDFPGNKIKNITVDKKTKRNSEKLNILRRKKHVKWNEDDNLSPFSTSLLERNRRSKHKILQNKQPNESHMNLNQERYIFDDQDSDYSKSSSLSPCVSLSVSKKARKYETNTSSNNFPDLEPNRVNLSIHLDRENDDSSVYTGEAHSLELISEAKTPVSSPIESKSLEEIGDDVYVTDFAPSSRDLEKFMFKKKKKKKKRKRKIKKNNDDTFSSSDQNDSRARKRRKEMVPVETNKEIYTKSPDTGDCNVDTWPNTPQNSEPVNNLSNTPILQNETLQSIYQQENLKISISQELLPGDFGVSQEHPEFESPQPSKTFSKEANFSESLSKNLQLQSDEEKFPSFDSSVAESDKILESTLFTSKPSKCSSNKKLILLCQSPSITEQKDESLNSLTRVETSLALSDPKITEIEHPNSPFSQNSTYPMTCAVSGVLSPTKTIEDHELKPGVIEQSCIQSYGLSESYRISPSIPEKNKPQLMISENNSINSGAFSHFRSKAILPTTLWCEDEESSETKFPEKSLEQSSIQAGPQSSNMEESVVETTEASTRNTLLHDIREKESRKLSPFMIKSPNFLDQSPWTNEKHPLTISDNDERTLHTSSESSKYKDQKEVTLDVSLEQKSNSEFPEMQARNFALTPENRIKVPSSGLKRIETSRADRQMDTQKLYESAMRNPWKSIIKKPLSSKSNKRVSFSRAISDDPKIVKDHSPDCKLKVDLSQITDSVTSSADSPAQLILEKSHEFHISDQDSESKSSPSICAMAEAFIAADREVTIEKQKNVVSESVVSHSPPQLKSPSSTHDTLENNIKEQSSWLDSPLFAPDPEINFNSMPDLDVEALLGGVGEFLEDWSVEAELKKIK